MSCAHTTSAGTAAAIPTVSPTTAIPLGARIFSVADTLDAVISNRPYREARPWATAVDEIHRGAGRQFDPRVARALHECEDELRAIGSAFAA